MHRLFIVEDDAGISSAIARHAGLWDLDTFCVQNFKNVMEDFLRFQPYIVLLDISLPFFDGYHWCNEIRKISQVPIIFISSAADNMNIIMTINMGADDFIAKPFDQSVLMAKIQALLRRSYDFARNMPVIEHRGAVLNIGEGTLLYKNEKIALTKNEYKILSCLLKNKGKVVSREKLMEELWQTDSFIDENTLTVNVNRLRRKLESAGLDGFIKTKFGVGYIVE